MALLSGVPARAQEASEAPSRPPEVGADAAIDDDIAAFYALLPEVVARELDVQRYERQTLGSEDAEKLHGHRQRRRQRIDDDAANFRTRASQFSVRPVALPGSEEVLAASAAGLRLGASELALLNAVREVYEGLAVPRRLEVLNDLNERFLAESNWASRDEGVRLRDTIMNDLQAFQLASAEAWRVVREDVGDQALEQLKAQLTELAPWVDLGSGSLGKLVLEDETTREQVLAEMRAALAEGARPPITGLDEAALIAARDSAQAALAKQTGVLALLIEDGELATELEGIELQLEDQGVNRLDPDARQVVLARRTEILRRRAAIREDWRRTPVPEPQLSEVLDAVQALLEKRLWDLGSHGALFAHRYDAAIAKRAALDPEISALIWDFMTEFSELSDAVAAAKPAPDPLAGMALGSVIVLDPKLKQQQAQILKLLQQAQAAATKSAAKPGAKGPLPKPKPKGKSDDGDR